MSRLSLILGLIITILMAGSCLAKAPQLINYQGLLTQTDGTPLNGPHDLTFKIYGSESGDDSLWWEHDTGVTVNNGLFNVILGSISSLSSSVFDDTLRYLGIAVGLDPELSPRSRLTSVPYAYHAATAEPDSDWGISGSDMYSAVSGNVGIGTTSPGYKLDVDGDIQASGYLRGSTFGLYFPNLGKIQTGNGNLNFNAVNGNLLFSTNGLERIRVDLSGNVGVGTASPNSNLDVSGTVQMTGFKMTTGATNGYILTSDASGVGTWQSASVPVDCGWTDVGAAVRLTTDTYSVGIGTSTPGEKLDVLGTAQMTGFKMPTGATNGYVLTSDASGIGTWQAASGGGGGGWIDDGTVVRLETSSDSIGIGTTSPQAHLDVFGDINADSVYKIKGAPVLSVLGTDNTLVGVSAGESDTGSYGTFVGYEAGRVNEANYNTFLGCRAGYTNNTGYGNTFLGRRAGYSNTSGYYNTFVGMMAGKSNNIGNSNTFVGRFAGQINGAGSWNAFLGEGAGYSNTSGGDNTYIGTESGYSNTTGWGNVFIGYNAGYNETGSNKLYVANGSSTSDVLIYGDFSTTKVGIGTTTPQGALDVNSTTGAFIVPRMTTTERDALTVVNGMIIYNTTTNQFNFYENGSWVTK